MTSKRVHLLLSKTRIYMLSMLWKLQAKFGTSNLYRTWHCHISVRGTSKFGTAKVLYVALIFFRTRHCPNFRTWHCQIWPCHTTVRGTAKFDTAKLLHASLSNLTQLRVTANFRYVLLPNCQLQVRVTAKLPTSGTCHCQLQVRVTAKLPTSRTCYCQIWQCQTSIRHCQIWRNQTTWHVTANSVRVTGTDIFPYVALPNLAQLNYLTCHSQTTVRGTADFAIVILPTLALPTPVHCQICTGQTTVRRTAEFPYVILPYLALPNYLTCHCQILVRGTAKFATAELPVGNLAVPRTEIWHC